MSNTAQIVDEMKSFFNTGKTIDLKFRLATLQKLKNAFIANKQNIYNALKEDLNKTVYEAYETEYGLLMRELTHTMSHLEAWAKPRLAKTSMTVFPGLNYTYKEPYGIVLIMSPWNYPCLLTFSPLISAVAAGNCAVVKPSNYSLESSLVIDKIITESFDSNHVCSVLGGREHNQDLLEQKFDYIFFTGGKTVGTQVAVTAAKTLTPVTLELGGKSPVIVDSTASLKVSAQRLVWGKLLNAGQTCIAPDYIFVHRDVKDEFIKYVKHYIVKFYTDKPQNNPKYCKIINEKHFNRLNDLIASGGQVIFGGQSNPDTMQIAPTLIDGVNWDMPVMREEIFGPIMPIMTFTSINEVIKEIKSQPKPLALYLFTHNEAVKKKFLETVSFGGGCINETVSHIITPYLPFGGIGESGMGSCHGKYGFETFTHTKGIIKKSTVWEPFVRNPPMNPATHQIMKFFMRYF